MPTVLITPEAMLHQPGPHIDILKGAGFEIRFPKDPIFTRGLGTEEQAIEELRGMHATLAGGEYYTAKVLAGSPSLRVVARSGVGFDRIDMAAATAHNVAITITPTANHEAVAEHALAMILAIAKGLFQGDRDVRQGGWSKKPTSAVRGKTLGVLGLGRIGRSMAIRGAGVRMKVIAAEKYPDHVFIRQHGIELVSFDDLLARSDYLTIHCPSNEETKNLFNRDVLSRMKAGSVLINTARGEIVEENDLADALKSGHLRAAGLDAFQHEPPDVSQPLFQLPQVLLTPHVAGADDVSSEAMAVEAAECIAKLYQGGWPEGAVVNSQLKAGWKW